MENLKFIKTGEIVRNLVQGYSYEDYSENKELKEKVDMWFKDKEEEFENLQIEDKYVEKVLKKINFIEEYPEPSKGDQELKELKELEINQLRNDLKYYLYGKEIYNKYSDFLKNKSLKERMDILLNTIGLTLEDNCIYSIMCELIKYVVCVQKNTNIICLGDKSTGKSFLYGRILNDDFIEKRSEVPTVAELRGNKNTKYKFLKSCIFDKKVFVIDELSSDPPTGSIAELKNVLENGRYDKADEKKCKTEISIVLNGNKYKTLNSFDELNKKYLREIYSPQLEDDALLDRFSGLLLHSTKLMGEKIYVESLDKYGISVIQFQSLIQYLREQEYRINFSNELDTERGSQSRKNNHVIKIVKGLLKLLYPNIEEVPDYVRKGLVEFALHFISLTQKNDNDMNLYNPFNENLYDFLLELYKEPNEEIDDKFFLKNRFYFKVKNRNYCKKVALTGFGIEDNKNEVEIIEKNLSNENIAKILNKTKYFNIIIQENKFKIINNKNLKEGLDRKVIEKYNKLLLENIEYHALSGYKIPNEKFIGVPNFVLNQLNKLAKLELTKILKRDINRNIECVYGYDCELELVNILEAIN